MIAIGWSRAQPVLRSFLIAAAAFAMTALLIVGQGGTAIG